MYRKKEYCSHCRGMGYFTFPCNTCKGGGYVEEIIEGIMYRPLPEWAGGEQCPKCGGKRSEVETCPWCKGSGYEAEQD
jgi:DnaJ-class molecular chaperone